MLGRVNDLMRQNKTLAVFVGLLMCFAIGAVDYTVGYEMSLSVFYLVPVLWVAWVAGPAAGYWMSAAGVLIWGLADHWSGHSYSSNGLLFWDILMRAAFLAVNVFTISKLCDSISREKETARLDHLTGAANSKAFFEMMQLEVYRCRRHKKPLSIAFMNCDNFKEVNDRFGHPKGDEFLKQVANTLKKELRATDILARIGGDEFAMALPEANAQDANAIFVRLRNSLDDAMRARGFIVTMSIGVASFATPPEDIKDLVAQAEKYMQAVKKHGKNRVNIQTIN